MHKNSMGMACGKVVAVWLKNPVGVPKLPTYRRLLAGTRGYNPVVMPRLSRWQSTAFTQALSTKFTLLSPLLYTVSTAPIKNKNYRN